MDVTIPLATPASPQACTEVLRTVVKHLLFSKRQIHAPYEQLAAVSQPFSRELAAEDQSTDSVEAEAGKTNRKRLINSSGGIATRKRRRLQQFLRGSEALLGSLTPELFVSQPVTRVLLLFGASISRPRDLYDLSFATSGSHQETAAMSAREMLILKNRVIRTLVSEEAAHEDSSVTKGPTALRIIALAPPTMEAGGFLPKRHLSISTRKCVLNKIRVVGSTALEGQISIVEKFARLMQQPMQTESSSGELQAGNDVRGGGRAESLVQKEESQTWFQSAVAVKGMASSS